MKKVFVILMSVLMAFLLGCEKDEWLPAQEETFTTEFRDVSSRPQWKMILSEMNNYILAVVEENILDAKLGEVLMKQARLIERHIIHDAMPGAKEQVRVFEGKVGVMVEKDYFPAAQAEPLLGMAKELYFVLDGKLVQARDGFESYPTGAFPYEGDWKLHFNGMGEGFQFVTDEVAFSGAKSLKLEGRLGWPAVAFKPITEPGGVAFAEARVLIQKPVPGALNNPKAGFGFGSLEKGYLGKNVHYAFVYFDTDGYLYFGATGVKSKFLMAWQGNKWYTIRIGYDAALNRGSLWIDGELMMKDFNLKGPEGSYAGILLDSGSDAHTFTCFDDVLVWKSVE